MVTRKQNDLAAKAWDLSMQQHPVVPSKQSSQEMKLLPLASLSTSTVQISEDQLGRFKEVRTQLRTLSQDQLRQMMVQVQITSPIARQEASNRHGLAAAQDDGHQAVDVQHLAKLIVFEEDYFDLHDSPPTDKDGDLSGAKQVKRPAADNVDKGGAVLDCSTSANDQEELKQEEPQLRKRASLRAEFQKAKAEAVAARHGSNDKDGDLGQFKGFPEQKKESVQLSPTVASNVHTVKMQKSRGFEDFSACFEHHNRKKEMKDDQNLKKVAQASKAAAEHNCSFREFAAQVARPRRKAEESSESDYDSDSDSDSEELMLYKSVNSNNRRQSVISNPLLSVEDKIYEVEIDDDSNSSSSEDLCDNKDDDDDA